MHTYPAAGEHGVSNLHQDPNINHLLLQSKGVISQHSINMYLSSLSGLAGGWLPRLGSGGWLCFMLWVQPKRAPHSERMAQGCSMYAHLGIQTWGSGHLEVLLGSPSSSPWWHRGTKRWTVTLLLCPMFYWPEPSPRADEKVKIWGGSRGRCRVAW